MDHFVLLFFIGVLNHFISKYGAKIEDLHDRALASEVVKLPKCYFSS